MTTSNTEERLLHMRGDRIVILTPGRARWLVFPFLYFFDSILLVDTTIICTTEKSQELKKISALLNQIGLSKKLILGSIYDFDSLRWSANATAARVQARKIRMQGRSLDFFMHAYICHKELDFLAERLFLRRITKVLRQRGYSPICLSEYALKIYFRWVSRTIEFFGYPAELLALSALMGVTLLKCVTLRGHRGVVQGGVAVDLLHGLGNGCGNPEAGKYQDDLFLVDNGGIFNIANHSFLDYGWRFENYLNFSSYISSLGGTVFGIRNCHRNLTWANVLKVTAASMADWIAMLRLIGDRHHYYPGINLVRFSRDLWLARLSFLQCVPSVYLSRMDYSYRNHAVGAVCAELKIKNFGISHAPLGGSGYAPHTSLLSFDALFVYGPEFSKTFFPTWSNNDTKLIAVGVWRGDYVYQLKRDEYFKEASKSIKRSFPVGPIVSVILPAPNTYYYNRESILRWTNIFHRLISELTTVNFILIPRRYDKSPEYFRNNIDLLTRSTNCELSLTLRPDWTQAYSWVALSDMVLGNNYSDAVLEALSNGIPAVSYSDVGSGVAPLERLIPSLSAYDYDSIAASVKRMASGSWGSRKLWEHIHATIAPQADGGCVERIKGGLVKFVEQKSMRGNDGPSAI